MVFKLQSKMSGMFFWDTVYNHSCCWCHCCSTSTSTTMPTGLARCVDWTASTQRVACIQLGAHDYYYYRCCCCCCCSTCVSVTTPTGRARCVAIRCSAQRLFITGCSWVQSVTMAVRSSCMRSCRASASRCTCPLTNHTCEFHSHWLFNVCSFLFGSSQFPCCISQCRSSGFVSNAWWELW